MSTINLRKEFPESPSGKLTTDELAAKLCQYTLPDWKGEHDFYSAHARQTRALGPVLEAACGTGRIAIHLAQQGFRVTGFDLSKEMLEIARGLSVDLPNIRWEQADMRSFEMGELYGLVVIPGHSFQYMLTSSDQMACLNSIKRHLLPGGRLIVHLDHQDLGWLWNQYREGGGKFEFTSQVPHPESGNPVQVSRAWSYEPCSQTAFVSTFWEERDAQGILLQRWERGPVALHCIFRFEMEHLLARAGFKILDLYGSFEPALLQDNSSEMIWVSEVGEENI